MLDLCASGEGCTVRVRVQPNARKSALAGIHNQSLKVALQAPAVDGKANKALVEYMADVAGISKSRVAILRGEKSRDKLIELAGIGPGELLERLRAHGLEIPSDQ